jgi:hypothetical protein
MRKEIIKKKERGQNGENPHFDLFSSIPPFILLSLRFK